MAEKLKPKELIQLVENITHPKGEGFTSEQINQQLLLFCINCPDPAAVMDLMVDCMTPMTPHELVDQALAYPPRDVSTLPESELALSHPLRHIKLDD